MIIRSDELLQERMIWRNGIVSHFFGWILSKPCAYNSVVGFLEPWFFCVQCLLMVNIALFRILTGKKRIVGGWKGIQKIPIEIQSCIYR